MRRIFFTFMLSIALLSLLTSCVKTVPKSEYDRVSAEYEKVNRELTMATRTINQQMTQLDEIVKKNSEYEVYAVVLDLLMYPNFVAEGLPTRFEYNDPTEWQNELSSAIDAVKDDTLTEHFSKYQKGEIKVFVVMDYLIGKIRQNSIIQ